MWANFMITMPSLTPLLQDPRYFDVQKKDAAFFNAAYLTTFNTGSMVGGLLASALLKYTRVSWSRLVIRLVTVASLLASLIYDLQLLLAMRALQGVCVGMLQPLNMAEAYRLSPKNNKQIVGNFSTFYLTLGIILGMVMTFLSNKGIIEWSLVFYFLVILELFTVLINVVWHRVDVSFDEWLQKNKDDRARTILSKFLYPETVEEIIKEEKEYIALKSLNKGKSAFRTNWREFLFALAITSIVVLTFSSSYSSFLITLTCKDVQSLSEATEMSFFSTIASVAEIVPKLAQILFPALISRRKLNFVLGTASLSLLWSVMGFLYYNEQWYYCKVMIVVWFFFIGMVIYPPYLCILSDVVTGELMGAVFSISKIMEIGVQTAVSSLLKDAIEDQTIYWKVAWGFASLSIFATLLLVSYLFETQGMSKVEIHNRLKGIKPEHNEDTNIFMLGKFNLSQNLSDHSLTIRNLDTETKS
jgi:MFS family permease